MAVDKKISQLASGAPAQAGDEYVVARSGANYKLTLTNIAASMPPIGATTPNTGSFTSLTNSGNLTFSGTGQRITGDFSGVNSARVYFQTSTTNGATALSAMPNGTGTQTGLYLYAESDLTNNSFTAIRALSGTDMRLQSGITGTGTYLPMTFYTGGSERMRLDTSGNLGIGTTTLNQKATIWTGGTLPSTIANCQLLVGDTTGFANAGLALTTNAGNGSAIFFGSTATPTLGRITYDNTNNDMELFTNSSARMRIDSSGNVGIGGTAGADTKVDIVGTLPTDTQRSRGFRVSGTIPSGTTVNAVGFQSLPATQAASFTLSNLWGFVASQGTFGASSVVTNQMGFVATSLLTGATNNYGFYSDIASGSNRWNFYAAGTAQNYFAGNTGIGVTPPSDQRLNVRGSDSTSSNTALVVSNSSATNMFYVRNDNYLNSAAVNNYSVAGTTVVIDGSNFLGKTTSSLRYKKDIVNYDKGLAAISKLRPVYYKSAVEGPNGVDPKQHAGLIAEEIEAEGFEEFLIRDNDGRAESIQYPNMVALLVKAIQELSAKVAALEAK